MTAIESGQVDNLQHPLSDAGEAAAASAVAKGTVDLIMPNANNATIVILRDTAELIGEKGATKVIEHERD